MSNSPFIHIRWRVDSSAFIAFRRAGPMGIDEESTNSTGECDSALRGDTSQASSHVLTCVLYYFMGERWGGEVTQRLRSEVGPLKRSPDSPDSRRHSAAQTALSSSVVSRQHLNHPVYSDKLNLVGM